MDKLFEEIIRLKEQAEFEQKRLSHEKYLSALKDAVTLNNEMIEVNIIQPNEHNLICPEPFSFVDEMNNIASQQSECKAYFQTKLDSFSSVTYPYSQMNGEWFNSTKKGINLRPGLLNNQMSSPHAVTLGDSTVHGAIVGRTGAGKSVFLNNLIMNLLYEYAPWELNLYLIDFKKVEFSRYMSHVATPHVNGCAATTEIRYVLSLFEKLVNEMKARQTLFSRLGVQKIEDFREQFNIILPRVLVVVDEFQQLFLEATNSESNRINHLLMQITKLGRATGFHLLFASQEMTSALSSQALANFKLRIALPCDRDVSVSLLGNNAASLIETGEVVINSDGGDNSQNQTYRVPFVNASTEENAYFVKYLERMYYLNSLSNFKKKQKYYQEDAIEKIEVLKDVLKKTINARENYISKSQGKYVDVLTLGRSVIYKVSENDFESFFIETGRNKNILLMSPNTDRLAYLQKLLAINFVHSSRSKRYRHIYLSLNRIVRNKYKIEDDLSEVVTFDEFDLSDIRDLYERKHALCQSYLEHPKHAGRFFLAYNRILSAARGNIAEYQKMKNDFGEKLEQLVQVDKLMDWAVENAKPLINAIESYRIFQSQPNADPRDLLDYDVIWINGSENIDKIDQATRTSLQNGLKYNVLFIFSTDTTNHGAFSDIFASCDYIFLDSPNTKDYEKCKLSSTNKSDFAITTEFKIKSLDTERAFKKFQVDLNDSPAPYLDFDLILG